MELGIKVYPILASKIYKHQFDFDGWPGNHPNSTYQVRRFNKSFFHLRNFYKDTFPRKEFDAMEIGKKYRKVFKI